MIALSPSRSDRHQHGLKSLWDMHILDGGQYNQLVHLLLSSELVLREKHGPLPEATRKAILGSGAAEVASICRNLGLEMSAKTAELMLADKETLEDLYGAIRQLANTVMLEMLDRKFYCPT